MKRAKHTPGPWTAEPHGEGIMIENGRDFVCKLIPGQYINETGVTEANARLISAAPELLKAAQLILEVLNEGMGGIMVSGISGHDALDELERAVLKATGGDHE